MDEEDVQEDEPQKASKEQEIVYRKKYKKRCNSRIDQLSTPNRRYILAVWQSHAYHFDQKRKEITMRRLQELYSMTAEQAEKYFEAQRTKIKQLLKKKKLREKFKKLYAQMLEKEARNKAWRRFRRLLRRGMHYAYTHPPPELVTSRLRKMSDLILKQLCEIRGVDVPERTATDKLSLFLMSIADWFAIFIAKMYFRVQLKKNQELEEIEEHERTLKTIDLDEGGPVATSTPKGSKAESDVLSAEVKVEEPDLTVNEMESAVRPKELAGEEDEG